MFRTAFDTRALSAMAAELGSDIPFFVYRSAAVCRGRGELVEPVEFDHALPLLLIKPEFGVPTPWAYKQWKESRELPGIPYQPQYFPWGRIVNDLERPVFEKYIFLALLKRWLLAQPEVAGALMSGSGSTTLAILHEASKGTALQSKIAAEFGDGLWICACNIADLRINHETRLWERPRGEGGKHEEHEEDQDLKNLRALRVLRGLIKS